MSRHWRRHRRRRDHPSRRRKAQYGRPRPAPPKLELHTATSSSTRRGIKTWTTVRAIAIFAGVCDRAGVKNSTVRKMSCRRRPRSANSRSAVTMLRAIAPVTVGRYSTLGGPPALATASISISASGAKQTLDHDRADGRRGALQQVGHKRLEPRQVRNGALASRTEQCVRYREGRDPRPQASSASSRRYTRAWSTRSPSTTMALRSASNRTAVLPDSQTPFAAAMPSENVKRR